MANSHPGTGAPVKDGECVCFNGILYCWDDVQRCWRNTAEICNPPFVENKPSPICGEAAST